MRVLNSTNNTTQSVLIGAKNCISKPLRATKLKKAVNSTKMNSKQIQRKLFSSDDKENQSPEKKESVLVDASKKIQKTSQKQSQPRTARKILGDITNTPQSKPSKEKTSVKPVIEKTFLEDEIEQTSNYVTLKYINSHTRHTYQFYCFHDRDLKVPEEFACKTLPQKCDNDCTTDEDQIRGAIKNVYKALETHVKAQQETDALLNKA